MIEILVVLALGLAAVVILPLLFLKLLFGIVVGLVLLPFKILGLLLRVVLGVAGIFAKVLFGGLGLVVAAVAVVVGLVLVPFLPILLIVGLVWLALRLGSRPAPLQRTI